MRGRRVVGQRCEVTGTLRAGRHRASIKSGRIGGVEASSLAREQVVVDGLGEQSVSEPISAASRLWVDCQDLRRDGLPEGTLDVGLGGTGDVGEEVGLDRAARHRGHPEDPLGILGLGCHASHQHVAQGRRQVVGGRIRTGRQEFLGEEGIALRSALDRVEQVRTRPMAEDGRDLRIQLGPPEPADLDSHDPRQAVHLR